MGYEGFKKYLRGIDLREALFEAQAFSYKLIMQRHDRDQKITITPPPQNKMYKNDVLDYVIERFNGFTIAGVDKHIQKRKDFYKIAKSILFCTNCHNMKRAKKQSTRVMREVKKMWKDGCYDGKDTNELAGLECFHKAYRETFIIVRTRFPEKVYNLIPSDLTIRINKGIVLVRDLYQKEAGSGLYVLDKNIKYTSREIRELQMTIAPHLFWELHHF